MVWFLHLVCFRVSGVFEGSSCNSVKTSALKKELSELDRQEKALDDLIQSSSTRLRELTEHKDNQRYPFIVWMFVLWRTEEWFVSYTFVSLFRHAVLKHSHGMDSRFAIILIPSLSF